ncbi:hypothetical protein CCYA_CCYA03G1114 [Cyanidiococcus yangmingshanensis]|nr:hypothetical protein CCYA_CCYA03G1114 [Cyanidiococcus yangmingshanensis]
MPTRATITCTAYAEPGPVAFILPLPPPIGRSAQRRRPRQRSYWRLGCVHTGPVEIDAQCTEPTLTRAPPTELVRYRAVVAYDGTDFHGFQRQSNSRAYPTIQSQLELVLQRRLGCCQWRCQVVGAGRTDAGVHARGQVVHFDIPESMAESVAFEPLQLQHAMNQLLPRTIQIRALEVAPPPQLCLIRHIQEYKILPWHAIYHARGKLYVYRMFAGQWRDPLHQRYVYSEHRSLPRWTDAESLLQAFVGTHDFGAFAHSPPNKADRQRVLHSTVRTVRRIVLVPRDEGGIVPIWQFHFELDGALYRMIRNLIGAFLAVAKGDLEPELVLKALEQGLRGRALIAARVKPAPAQGLCLEQVYYADGYPIKHSASTNTPAEGTDTIRKLARGAPFPNGAELEKR